MNPSFTREESTSLVKEHTLQIELIHLLENSIVEKKSDSEKITILDQLISFSQVHFMSEQLVMRHHSYDGYDEHEIDHIALVEQLQELKDQVNSGSTSIDQPAINQLRDMLINHINSHDQKLSSFLTSMAESKNNLI